MVEQLHIPSESILILVLNRTQSLEWRTKTLLKGSGTIWRTSYYGFIQGELKTYYPVLLKNCRAILNRRIKPVFLTFESAQFLVSKVIEWQRINKGAFEGVTSYSDRIAIDITANLVKAATSGIPYNEIGSRLYNALELKDDLKRKIFKDADDITGAYREKCMEMGILDFGMAVDLYHNYLLTDETYRSKLLKRIRHLMVDNLEECVPAEIDLIEFLLPNIDTCLFGYNHEGGYGEVFGSNHEYAKERIINKCDIVEIDKSYTCKDYMYEFSDMLFDNIEFQKGLKYRHGVKIERNPPVELRSEMLELVGEKICSLIHEENYSPSDIAVISTYADPVTEFVIGRILEKKGCRLKNLARKNRIIDNPFVQALVTLSELCHPSFAILPNRDDVKALVRLLLKVDPVRSSILAGEICSQRPFAKFPDVEFPGVVEKIGYYNIKKYEYIRNWIEEYKAKAGILPINEFLQKVFLEILVSGDSTDSDILQAKKLIDSARSFAQVVSRFSNINADKGFIDMVKSGIKSSESIFELEEKTDGGSVILATPAAYIAGSLKSKVMILTSLSSKNWTPRSIKELTNVHVLTKTWNTASLYTEELETKKQKQYLAILMRLLIKKCEDKLITFESDLSANGFENEGILSEFFDEILE